MTRTTEPELRIVALDADAGEARWWFGERATIKLTAEQTGGAYSLVEVVAPPGLTVPLHVHGREDETFVVLEGEAEFRIGATEILAGPGSVLLAPRGVPHSYAVGDAGATMLFVFSPGGFEGFVRASSVPAERRGLPPAELAPPPDVAAIAHAYGAEILDAA